MAKWAEKEAAVRALERSGMVDPNDLIKAARHPGHPWHDGFTWDVTQAAAERWREQARAIIRQLHFEVLVEEVGVSVVAYVPNPDKDDHRFASLPKIRSKVKVSLVLAAEIHQLVGVAGRVYGIAVSKQNIVGAGVVTKLRMIRDMVAKLEAELEG